MTKCFFILEILIKEGLAANKTQFEIKQEARYHKGGGGGDYLITLYVNVFFKSIQPMTHALQSLTNTSSVFS